MKGIIKYLFGLFIIIGLLFSVYNLGKLNVIENQFENIVPLKDDCENFCKSIEGSEDVILSCQVGCLYSTNLQLEFIQNSYLD